MTRPRLRACAINLGLLAASSLLVLFTLEVALRITAPGRGDWYAAGPERLRFLRDHVRRNADGFRDDEFPPPRPDVRTILALGDSFTFGDGIERVGDTWPEVLERLLSGTAGRWQVHNFGVPGTNTAFQRRMLTSRGGWRLQPDRIVLGFVLNDPEPADANTTIVPTRLDPPLIPLRGLDRHLRRVSHAYAFLRRSKNALLERFGWKPTYAEYVHELYVPDSASWRAFVAEARGLVEDTRLRGVPLTVVLFPMFSALEHYPFHEEHRRAFEVFERAGADVLDLLPRFDGKPTREFAVSPTDAHPNERAHRLAAEAIHAHLLEVDPSIRAVQ